LQRGLEAEAERMAMLEWWSGNGCVWDAQSGIEVEKSSDADAQHDPLARLGGREAQAIAHVHTPKF
jgi:hypothetical protein